MLDVHHRSPGRPVGLVLPMRPVYVIGSGMTRFTKQPSRSLKELAVEAVSCALRDAGKQVQEIEAIYFANAVAGSITGAESLAGPVGRSGPWFAGVPGGHGD